MEAYFNMLFSALVQMNYCYILKHFGHDGENRHTV
jgi:hypothetical protein